jgi:hypothetical protein
MYAPPQMYSPLPPPQQGPVMPMGYAPSGAPLYTAKY